MPRNKLYQLVKSLKKEELKDVAAFIKKERPAYEKCFQLLCKFHPHMREGHLKKEDLFAAVYGQRPYDDLKLRQLKTRLCRAIEDYLALTELDRDERTRNELLVQALAYRSNYPLFKDYANRRLKLLEQQPERGKEHFLEKAFHYRLLYLHPETEQMDEGGIYLREYIHDVEMAHAYTLLEMASEHQLGLRNMQALPKALLDENGLKMAANKAQRHLPLQLFYQLYQLYQTGTGADNLQGLLQLLKKCLSLMAEAEKRMAIKLLTNWCIPLSNQGSGRHSRFIFDVFRFAVENGLVVEQNGLVNPGNFSNIVMAAVKANQLEWAEALVAEYARLLPEEVREIVENLCFAAIYYKYGHRQNKPQYFRKVLSQLGDSPQRIPERYNIRYRTTAIRANYELVALHEDYLDDLDRSIKNFERYLKKNRLLPKEKKQSYFRFIDSIKRLGRLATNPDRNKTLAQQLIVELKSGRPIALQSWLEEKAEGLLQSLRR